VSPFGKRGDDVTKYRARRRRKRSAFSTFALLLVIAGLGLVAYTLLGANSPLLKAVDNATGKDKPTVTGTTLKLTIPKMERVKDLNVYDAPGDDESALEDGAMHLQSTGFPWQQGSNVYIAGHRMGYLGTDSYLVFYDLDELVEGDQVILTDANGTRYTYEVFKNFIAGPNDWSVIEPIPGRSIVSLQTCTLPDYTQRVIVQAELVNVA
jgi:sortase A